MNFSRPKFRQHSANFSNGFWKGHSCCVSKDNLYNVNTDISVGLGKIEVKKYLCCLTRTCSYTPPIQFLLLFPDIYQNASLFSGGNSPRKPISLALKSSPLCLLPLSVDLITVQWVRIRSSSHQARTWQHYKSYPLTSCPSLHVRFSLAVDINVLVCFIGDWISNFKLLNAVGH